MKYAGILRAVVLTAAVLSAGCVERKLTIVTEPENATVWLNDEEIGTTPVTVNFNWYGDYRIRIEKPGYSVVNTHQKLKRPLHDVFPFDFFAQHVWPGRIVDTYTWTYPLTAYQEIPATELIKAANTARAEFQKEIDDAQRKIQAEKSK